MEQPLFTNSYVRDEELAKEFYRYSYFGKPVHKIFAAIYIFLLAMSVFAFVKDGNPEMLIYCIVIIALVVGMLIWVYKRSVKAMLAQSEILLSGELPALEFSFFDNEIKTKATSGEELTVSYEKIKRVQTTKNLILLSIGMNMFFILKKDAFVLGSYESFVIFLKNKGIKVK